mmetsp:Transcript_26826/g.39212  ORF Transcript_26826/g.39212 Transcript_26826/m.39212 type:complete len:848 (-) Transcript_26826:67-2610(-)
MKQQQQHQIHKNKKKKKNQKCKVSHLPQIACLLLVCYGCFMYVVRRRIHRITSSHHHHSSHHEGHFDSLLKLDTVVSTKNAGLNHDERIEQNEVAKTKNGNKKDNETQQLTNKEEKLTTPHPIMTAYLEKSTYPEWYSHNKIISPLPPRNTTSSTLQRILYPPQSPFARNQICHDNFLLHNPSVDTYNQEDAYLPWIHDVFLSSSRQKVVFVAQNRRKCHTGDDYVDLMEALEGQVALFQPVSVQEIPGDVEIRYKLAPPPPPNDSFQNNTFRETRFICRFKLYNPQTQTLTFIKETTTSTYPFNYEYIHWRKKRGHPMFEKQGKDSGTFWLSSLMFDCPLPSSLQISIPEKEEKEPIMYVDVIPIRTPVRGEQEYYFQKYHHGGLLTDNVLFDADKAWGVGEHVLPKIEDSGRWENIPICPRLDHDKEEKQKEKQLIPDSKLNQKMEMIPENPTTAIKTTRNNQQRKKRHKLVGCAWTSSSHKRRGEAVIVQDGPKRLIEWITFHLMVGFDHLYIYDNTPPTNDTSTEEGKKSLYYSPLQEVTSIFPPSKVTHVPWPYTVCNNNRPMHKDPGERSSQYAAESSCRLRYGDDTDWMANFDPDEYLIPMGKYENWKDFLQEVDDEGMYRVLKFRSSGSRPIVSLMETVYHNTFSSADEEEKCLPSNSNERPCLAKRANETYFKTYNCEYIKPPKPERFQRAMKQIYRPDYVLSHYIHYSTVNTDLARTQNDPEEDGFRWSATYKDRGRERFADEINEGVLKHARGVVPAWTARRFNTCRLNSKDACILGHPCSDDTPFDDATHQKNIFTDKEGNYCNCWINRKAENVWAPRLERELANINMPLSLTGR